MGVATSLRINVVCRNFTEDRVLPRFARYLSDRLGWLLTPAPMDPRDVDVFYLMGYFESQLFAAWPARPVASLFTHREENHSDKQRLFDAIAQRVDLRVSMSRLYGEPLAAYGPTIQPPLPLEREHFTIAPPSCRRSRPVVGVSGYVYRTGRKGEDLIARAVTSPVGRRVEWTASGRGWPIRTRTLRCWQDMPRFYQGLDVLVCPSLVEGGPMPVLEALACGVSVVVPRGVGILDELPDTPGIERYPRGDWKGLVAALERAAFPACPVDREALRAATLPHSVEGWCSAHAEGFAQVFGGLTR